MRFVFVDKYHDNYPRESEDVTAVNSQKGFVSGAWYYSDLDKLGAWKLHLGYYISGAWNLH